MTAYLKRGDRIMIAVPDFIPHRTSIEDCEVWQRVYDAFGVEVVHVAVHHALAHPVVVAVLREDDNPAEGDPA